MSTTWETTELAKRTPAVAVTERNTDTPPVPAQSPYTDPGYTPVKPQPARPSAAMVVAKAAGRSLGTSTRWVVTGVARSGRQWVELYHDNYPHEIRLAKNERKAAEGTAEADAAKAKVKEYRREHRKHRIQHLGYTSVGALATGGTLAIGGAAVGGWLDLLLAGFGVGAAAWHGQRGLAAIEAAPGHPAIGGPLEGEVVTGGQSLLDALAAIKVPDGSRVVAHQPGPDGTSVTIVDLPPNFTVTSIRNKVEELAGALGRDVTMVDIQKARHANQAAVWVSAADPFEATRPSPLMEQRTPLDTWANGAPVAWGKRGNVVRLPIRDSHVLIGGTTRSGKGVGMANFITAAAMDPRVNLRIVPGKVNGEFDAYAKAGVAATYFKPNPARLLALTEVLLEEMDRRNAILGRLGKSKMTPETIMELGGIELVVIDELATYTAQGSHPDREQLAENLMKLAAVATGAGILLVLATQLPQVDVVPSRLAMNCLTKWAMRVDTAQQSNTILGGGSAGAGGPDASRFDPPRPGLGWLVNPFVGITDLARSFDLDQDVRGEITTLMERAAGWREAAGRLVGQWDDPVERALAERTGLSSAAGGPNRDGVPGRMLHLLDPQAVAAYEALADAVEVMKRLGRDAQVEEMASELEMPTERLGELLRRAGAGSTVKINHPERGRVNGYRKADLIRLLDRAAVA
ncbi:FtsK/SpoIIIE domain-containing protein [Streptomyces sp. NPDC020983]|uniref:FtsK/SpoIIIE domain-containing protein n=1 Tax=Streptomyces sp. NPDC020983 TaxID=3365106 RepID=UPI00378EFD8E